MGYGDWFLRTRDNSRDDIRELVDEILTLMTACLNILESICL